jgi:hypothetical protein
MDFMRNALLRVRFQLRSDYVLIQGVHLMTTAMYAPGPFLLGDYAYFLNRKYRVYMSIFQIEIRSVSDKERVNLRR